MFKNKKVHNPKKGNFNNERFYNPKIKNSLKDKAESNYQEPFHEPLGPTDLFFSVLYDASIIFRTSNDNDLPPEFKKYIFYLTYPIYEQHKNSLYLDLRYSNGLLEIKKYGGKEIFYISPKNLRINLLYILYWWDMEYNHITSASSIVNNIQLFKYSSRFLTLQFGLVLSDYLFFRTVLGITDFLVHFKLEDSFRKTKIKKSKSTRTQFSMGGHSYTSNALPSSSVFKDFSILSNIVYQTPPKTLDKMVSIIRTLL